MSVLLHGKQSAGRWCALLVAFVLGACSEGYSTRESVLILNPNMGQERALEALNKLGHQQPSDFHWHYRMLPDCVLEVHARRFWGDRAPQQVALRQVEARDTRAADTGDFTASLVSRTDPTMEVLVLERMDEVDASQVTWLLGYLPRFCETTEETRR